MPTHGAERFFTSKLTKAASGRVHAAARMAATSASAPPARPAPYWSSPTAALIWALAAAATMLKANLARASPHTIGLIAMCSGVVTSTGLDFLFKGKHFGANEAKRLVGDLLFGFAKTATSGQGS